jgi:hypothetical protein
MPIWSNNELWGNNMAMQYYLNVKPNRNSGIEVLKIIAIWFVIIKHICDFFGDELFYFSPGDLIDFNAATEEWQQLALIICQGLGLIGNNIFFVCSAWFLLENEKIDRRKCFFMLVEIWAISVSCLVGETVIRGGIFSSTEVVIKSIMPSTFGVYWYMTCYLLFYAIHGFLNQIIYATGKRNLFRMSFILCFLYIFIGTFKGLFYTSYLIQWIAIYFVVAYIKLYLKDMSESKKMNVFLLCIGIVGYISLITITNYIGLRFGSLSDKMSHWNRNCNLFFVLIAISVLLLAKKVKFTNRIINYVSKLSMLIYVFHNNPILRKYYSVYVFQCINKYFGHERMLLGVLFNSIVVFVCFTILCAIYDVTLRKLVKRLSYVVYEKCCLVWHKFEKIALTVH